MIDKNLIIRVINLIKLIKNDNTSDGILFQEIEQIIKLVIKEIKK